MRNPTKNILIVQHTDTTTPGSVPALLSRAGHQYRIGQMHRGFRLPSPTAFDAVVVCGGGVHVHQEDRFPFLRPEKEFLREAIQKKVPTMGLCLGAQLIAVVLGAECYPNPAGWEVGWHDVEMLADDGVPGFTTPARRRVSQYHRYVFDLPTGARRIARNDFVPTQAFAYADHVLAFGFHPERTVQSNHELAREADLPTEGRCQRPADILRDGAEGVPRITPWFEEILRGFLK